MLELQELRCRQLELLLLELRQLELLLLEPLPSRLLLEQELPSRLLVEERRQELACPSSFLASSWQLRQPFAFVGQA